MEKIMNASPTPRFEVPEDMRAVAERSVEQAKTAFTNYMRAAEKAVSTLEERVTANQAGALGISRKAMTFAEKNVLSAFEAAQKIVQTKDIQQVVRMHTEYLQSQIQALSEQVTDLGNTVNKLAMKPLETPAHVN
jgi:phasin